MSTDGSTLGPQLHPAVQNPQLPPAVQSALADCEVIVDKYRRKEFAKGKALHEIYQKLSASGASEHIESAFSSYLKALDDHDHIEDGAASRGGRAAPSVGPQGIIAAPGLEKQSRQAGSVDYPWTVTEFIESSLTPLSPSLTETLRIIKLMLDDHKGALRSILTSARAPEFPTSEWNNLVRGQVVNLDVVLSDIFSTTADSQHTESLGEGVELRFNTVAPVKIVLDAGSWTIAWDRMVTAVLFIFPHRARELSLYREYIVGQFAATHSAFHSRIIALDRAVRKRVAQRRDMELTDFARFADIKTAVVDSIGVDVVASPRESRTGPIRKPRAEVCNNWNSGRCTADAGKCRRLHLCYFCKGNHRAPECPDVAEQN